jgi:hypothetical protein
VTIWIEQFQNSRNYDKATENFLLTILPHLAKVITQNGIYWLAHFPEHQMSRLLLKIFGESYVDWATENQQWVQDHEGGLQVRQIENLMQGHKQHWQVFRTNLGARQHPATHQTQTGYFQKNNKQNDYAKAPCT